MARVCPKLAVVINLDLAVSLLSPVRKNMVTFFLISEESLLSSNCDLFDTCLHSKGRKAFLCCIFLRIDFFFFFSSLIHFILRYYEDFKIDRKTGEANLTQIYLQVLSILILVSKLQ